MSLMLDAVHDVGAAIGALGARDLLALD